MHITRARPDDAATLTEIAFAAKRHWGYPMSWIESWRDVLTVRPEFIAGYETYAAIDESRAIGFYALGRKGEPRAASSSPSSPREERVGRGPRRGETNKNAPPLPSPLLHPMEEREKSRRLMQPWDANEAPTVATPPQPGHTAGEVRRAWAPWLLLSLLVFIWGIPQVKNFFNGEYRIQTLAAAIHLNARFTAPQIAVARLHNVVLRAPPVAPVNAPPE